jgi:hypothetical protein
MPHGAFESDSDDDDQWGLATKIDWVGAQQKTFLTWVNQKLMEGEEKQITVNKSPECCKQFANGVVIWRLLQCLTAQHIKGIDKKPRVPLQVSNNWGILFKFMSREKISTGGINALNLSHGNQKICLALIYKFWLKYTSATVMKDEPNSSLYSELLEWVKPRVVAWKIVNNFDVNWKDGDALLALYDYGTRGKDPRSPAGKHILPFELMPEMSDEEKITTAFEFFENHYNVPQMLEVEQLTQAKRPDKKSVMMYIERIRAAVLLEEQAQLEWEEFNNKANDEAAKKERENKEHMDNGDMYYKKGVTKIGSTSIDADALIVEIIENQLPKKLKETEGADPDYGEITNFFMELLENDPGRGLVGFDKADEFFGLAIEEYENVDPTPADRVERCNVKKKETVELREEYREKLRSQIAEIITQDTGRRKYEFGVDLFSNNTRRAGGLVAEMLDNVKTRFESTRSSGERDLIVTEVINELTRKADEIYDPCYVPFNEATVIFENVDPQTDFTIDWLTNCDNRRHDIDDAKRQLIETVRTRTTEMKVEAGDNDELTPEELLQMYHQTTIVLEELITNRKVVDEGIPNDAGDIKKHLEEMLLKVKMLFGEEDNLRFKIHESVDVVFDANGLY